MVSLVERVREIRRIGAEAKRSGEPVGRGAVPRQVLVVASVLVALTLLPVFSKVLGYVKGGRGSGAEGGARQVQGGQAGASSGLVPSGVPPVGGVASAEGQYRVFYAPDTDLEKIDAQVLSSAQKRIDLALHADTDESLCRVVAAVAKSGVPVRLLRERRAFTGDGGAACKAALVASGVKIRVVPAGETLRLESYVVDEVKLRSGAADLTAAGERSEDADLVLVGSAAAVAGFEKHFDRLWDNSEERVGSVVAR